MPDSALARSMASPVTSRSSSAESPDREGETSHHSAEVLVERPKRCRVTPEQLVPLERFFSLDPSPTATRRREISEELGMQERQTQIWFQNRRAKARNQNAKLKRAKEQMLAVNGHSPVTTAFEDELNRLIHEDDPVTFIPCSDLTIGSWRRIAADSTQRDLVAYTCEARRCLTWFIHNGGCGFKMELPFDTIIDTEFSHSSTGIPASGMASFVLSQPPLFYLEYVTEDRSQRRWKRCTDWTEGHQASHVLRHDVIGPTVPLVHLLQSFRSGSPRPYASPVMELPPPPLHAIAGSEPSRLDFPSLFRRRSMGGMLDNISHGAHEMAPAMSFTHTAYLQTPAPLAGPDEYFEDYASSYQTTPAVYSAQLIPRHPYAPENLGLKSPVYTYAPTAETFASMYYTPSDGLR